MKALALPRFSTPQIPRFELRDLTGQFKDLDQSDPGSWPLIPQLLALVLVALVVVGVGWIIQWQGQLDELELEQQKEAQLKEDYQQKVRAANNLAVLKKQKEQVGLFVSTLEKQLPSKAEMDALLSDVNQAGIGRGLQFDLFKPGQQIVKAFYAEMPIQLRVVGSYHDLGHFASDLANMPRIVTLQDVTINAAKDGLTLSLDAIAKTFRYLDPEEVATNRREQEAKKKGGKR